MQPHRSNYWEHPNIKNWKEFATQVTHLCELHGTVQELAAAGTHVISIDEKTGIQALEREHETIPMAPGKGEKREFNYIRHGTQVLTGNLDLANGALVAPTVADTRTEKDFVSHIRQTMNSSAGDGWIFLTDQLNTHKSASLVEYVASITGDRSSFDFPPSTLYCIGIISQ